MKQILVLCIGNSCRSQMAEGYLRHYANGKAKIYSAGIETHGVNPRAIAAMRDDGIDISHHTSNKIDEYRILDFDYIITVCDQARENCPYFSSTAKRFHHNFQDPAKWEGSEDEIIQQFRKVRDLVKIYCEKFIEENF